MKKLIIVIALVSSNLAFANDNSVSPSPMQGVGLRCAVDGAQEFALNLKNQRVWMTEKGYNTGIEMEVTSFKRARCFGCFEIKGNLLGSHVEIRTSDNGGFGKKPSVEVSIVGTASNGKSSTELLKGQCY